MRIGVLGRSVLAFLAVSAGLAFGSPAVESRVVKHDDDPPSTRNLHVKPIPALGTRHGANASLGSIGVARDGDVFFLTPGEQLAIYDPISNSKRDVRLEVPEKFKGQSVAFFTFDTEGGVHVCYQPASGLQSSLVSYDLKGRVTRTRSLPVIPFLASAAVAPNGDLYLSTMSPRGITGGPEKALAPMAPVLVIDKDGSLKSTVGTWDQVDGNPAEVALRNLRLVVANDDGSVVLIRKDKFEFEVIGKNGNRIRTVSVDAKDQRKPHLYEKPATEKAGPGSSASPPSAKDESEAAAVEPSSEDSASNAPPPNPNKAVRSNTKMTVDIPSLIRGVAVQGDRIYILRNPYAYGGKDPRPAIDVFDFFGKWEEEYVLDSHERFDNLAVGRDGSLYLISAQADSFLWVGDLGEQPTAPLTTGARPRK